MTSSPRSQPRRSAGTRRRPARASRRRVRRRLSFAAGLITLAGLLSLVAAVIPARFEPPFAGEIPLAEGSRTSSESPVSPAPDPTAESTPTSAVTPEAPLLRVAGRVPAEGSGSFAFGLGQGEVVGRAGLLRRYRVAVEKGAGEDLTPFVSAVESALGNPGSWTAGGQIRLQRVPDGVGHDFTIYLATPKTAGTMCAVGGVDIRVNGRPYTSCRATGKVIINLERWRRSVDHFVADEVPLAVYRDYVINHEVGHELGNGHERCPGRGRPAPVMMQQTLFLDGCVANPWPFIDGRRHAGPLL